MEQLMNNPFILKLQEFSQKLAANKFLSALQSAMMSLMMVIMIGAISSILCTVGSESMLGLFQTGGPVYSALYAPYTYTMGLLSVWLVLFISYNYSKSLELEGPLTHALTSTAVFLLVAAPVVVSESGVSGLDTSYLGAQGMFVGFLVVLVTVRIDWLCATKNIYIHMPDVVPQFLQDGFAGIVPLLFSTVVFTIVNVAVSVLSAGAYTLSSGFMALIAVPLAGLTSLPGIFIILIVTNVLWCFGIHGGAISWALTGPLQLQAIAMNAELAAAGQPPVFLPVMLLGCQACAGGCGNTLPLALLCSFSKSKQLKAVGRAATIPGIFNISEPAVFGVPIMYNPIMWVPFLLNLAVGFFFYWFGYAAGILTPWWIPVLTSLPIGVMEYMQTLNPMNTVWALLMIPIAGIIYFPFFKVYERQLLKKEQEEAVEHVAA